jgi:hypothetical protein
MSTSNITTIAGAVIIVALVGAVAAMAFNGTITGDVALAFLAPLATLAGGIVAHATGVTAGSNAAVTGATTTLNTPTKT